MKKSFYEKNQNKNHQYDNIINGIYQEKNNSGFFKNIKKRIIFGMYIKTTITITVFIFIIVVKVFGISSIRNLKVTERIIKEYKNNYSYSNMNNIITEMFKRMYKIVTPIIPESFKGISKRNNIKEKIEVYNEIKIYNEENKTSINNGKGGAIENTKNKITAESSISSEDQIIEKINQLKVVFVSPAKGVISSSFGDREEIFKGIGTYHTGVDIANDKGTEIYSSTSGVVTIADYNKYNGNYVEIKNGKITTKYCHMEKRLVKVGEKVKAGTRIGLMGSTGLSTGPHLHFEIIYEQVKVNPEKVLEI